MFILKFFASLFILFIGLVFLFFIFTFLIAKKAVDEINDSLVDKMETSNNGSASNDDIPEAIECKACGTYYAVMPEDKKCSCGASLV